MNTLPDKPSELIRVAIRDLEAVEKLPEVYEIDMKSWHEPGRGYSPTTCAVCLAGAVMAQTLGANPREFRYPTDYAREIRIQAKLRALNMFREGEISNGLYEFGYDYPMTNIFNCRLCALDYDSRQPEVFKQQMLSRAEMLEREGL